MAECEWDDWFLDVAESTRVAREYLSAAVADDSVLVAQLWESGCDKIPTELALLWEPYLAYLRTQGIDEAEYWRGFCAWMSQTEALIGVGGHPFSDNEGDF